MNNSFIKIFAGANKVFRNTQNIIKDQHSDYIEQNILQNKYVSREEFDQLKKLVMELQTSIKNKK